jgi:hypothetical protein
VRLHSRIRTTNGRKLLGPMAALVPLVAAWISPTPPLSAQAPGVNRGAGPVPRTQEGKPDFRGFWSFNLPNGAANIETGVGLTGRDGGKVIVEPADGRVPLTAAARAKADDIAANKMILEPSLHCFPGGVAHQTWMQFGAQYVQNKDTLLMLWEMNHDRRIIPLDG